MPKRLKLRNIRYLCLLCMGLLAAGTAQGQSIEAEGTAIITTTVGAAKRMAMQDAIRQALIQANTQVSTTTVVNSQGVVSDNVRYSSRGSVTNVVVVDEWTDESNYYVRIRPEAQEPEMTVPASSRSGVGRQTTNQMTEEAVNAPTYTVRIRAEVPGPEVIGGGTLPVANRRSGISGGRTGIRRQSAARSGIYAVNAPTRVTLRSGDPGTATAPPVNSFSAEAAAHYRRKLAVTQFHVLDRAHITDLPNIEVGLARELKRRLDATGNVRTVDASQYLVPLNGDEMVSQRRILGALPPARDAGQMATEFAESLSVQYVVSGVIRDMSVTKHLLGAKVRHLEIDLVMHDGITGAEVARHRVNESVPDGGLLDFKTSAPVLNDKFYASPFGNKVNRALDRLVSLLSSDLTHQPFTARVIRTEGSKVFFDAGGLANVKVGDFLNTYQLEPSTVKDLAGQRSLGFQETPTTGMVVTQVQRLFSVGELESETARLSPGDVIRFDP